MSKRYKIGISTRLGLQAAYFLIGNIFTLLVGFPLQIFVARMLGAGELGLFSVAEGIMGVVASLLGLGLAQTLVKFIPICLEHRDYRGLKILVKSGLRVLLAGGLLAVLVAWLSLPVLRQVWDEVDRYPYLLTAMSWLIPLTLLIYFFQQGLRGFQEMGFVVITNSFLQLGTKAVLAVALLLLGFGLAGYVTAVIVSSMLACVCLLVVLWRKVVLLPQRDANQTSTYDPAWTDYARVMYSNSLLSIGASYLDRFLVGWLQGPVLVGILLVAKQLQQMPGVFLQMFMAVVTPMFSSAHAREDSSERLNLLHFTVDWVVRLAMPLCLFLLLFAENLLSLYGPEFAEKGAATLRILVLAQLTHLALGPVAALLNMSGMEKFLLRLAVWEQLFIIGGMFMFVPQYGLAGAAIVLALNALWQNVTMVWVAKRELGIVWYDRRYLRWIMPTLFTAAFGITVELYGPVNPGVTLLILALVLLYLVFNLLFLMQDVHEEDRLLFEYVREKLVMRKGLGGLVRELLKQHIFSRLADFRGRGVYSLYADQYRCIFIHIPKAAGTSVALTLFNQGSRHVPWFDYYYANPEKFRRYYKFSFVRNPWDRLVSTYFFLQRGGMNDEDAAWARENLAPYPTFESFVKGWLNDESIHSWEHFRPQHYFLCDEEGRVQMDFVGRVENMEEDFGVVARRLGCSRQLAKVNVGNLNHYSRYYTDESREIVARVYQRDIEIFGYQFEQR